MKSKIYNLLVIPPARLFIFFLKLFNNKLARREQDCEQSLNSIKELEKSGKKRIWFHAASMGEFEQAKPLIEMIKCRNPEIQIIVTFFSPSGYINQKNYSYADAVSYMPFDTLKNVINFIELAKPDTVVFVRYEIWRNYLEQIRFRNIPLYLICATEPTGKLMKSSMFKKFTARNYNYFTKIFTVGNNHTEFFKKFGVRTNIETLSDTRYDRIIENITAGKEKMILQGGIFKDDEFIVVAGSTWKPDEDIIINTIEKLSKEGINFRVIFVPHEPTPEHVNQLKSRMVKAVTLSDLLAMKSQNRTSTEIRNYLADNHLIVDSIGKLLGLYKYATIAYIGGAFGVGVHSVAEPAGYGIPLACGPRCDNSHDAIQLIRLNALTVIKNNIDFYNWVKSYYQQLEKRTKTGKIAKEYIFSQKGTTEKIFDSIKYNLLD
jgi:3-deoxy-D-manno-octulosonic-acid transferase